MIPAAGLFSAGDSGGGPDKVSAAVVLIVFMIAIVVLYLILVPAPVAYQLITGKNITSPTQNVTHSSPQQAEFYYPISNYVGETASPQSYSYQLGTFGVSYKEYNSTIGVTKPFTLTSSIFGSSNYNIKFNATTSDSYFLIMNISSVSGSPSFQVYINGHSFYRSLPAGGEDIALSIPSIRQGSNVLSIYNYLNGLALSEGISFSSVQLIQMSYNNAPDFVSTKVMTLSGIGNFYLDYFPIGTGPLQVKINNTVVSSIENGSDSEVNITIPPSLLDSIIPQSNQQVLPITFGVGFIPGKTAVYEIGDAQLVYQLPAISQNNLTVPFSVNASGKQYLLTLYLNNIISSGSVNFKFSPSEASISIPGSKLTLGTNVLIIPPYYLAGLPMDNNYTGTLTISSDGLLIPSYVAIKPLS
ncbi:hypothetical protein M1293_03640 [Candidatus Parvarchaeota archaeon]|nr:hypothetical protein [Candidatus Parvarchaeota archaeon]